MKKKNKSVDISSIKNVVIVVLALVIVFGGSILASNIKGSNYSKGDTSAGDNTGSSGSTAEQESAAVKEDEQKEHTSIGVDKYLELKKGSEYSVIYIARPTCHYCTIQSPILKNIAFNYDIEINYLDTDELDDDDAKKLTDSDDYLKEGYGTPLVIVVKDDEFVGKVEGLTDTKTMIDFFKSNKVISE